MTPPEIPIAAARVIAEEYGYDQVVVIGRKVGSDPEPNGEHVTTFGVNAVHRHVAAAAGRAPQRFMRWPLDPEGDPVVKALTAASHALRSYQHGNSSPDLAAEIADACDEAIVALLQNAIADARRIEAGEAPLVPEGIDPPVRH